MTTAQQTTTASQERTMRYFADCLRDGYTAEFARQEDGRVKVTVRNGKGGIADVFAIDKRGFTVAL